MKRRTGNGTNNRQWLYIMVNVPLFFLCKIGISGNKNRRAREVSEKVFGWAIPVFAVYIPFAFALEQSMHRLFGFANVRFGGSREWFLFPVAPVAAFIMFTVFLLEYLLWFVAVLFVIWLFSGMPQEPVQRVKQLLFDLI